jgi:hypothetical protein
VEPFFGSGAVLLARPTEPGIETINDADGFVSNFWRAVQADPQAVAEWANWPVYEADLYARHVWLVRNPPLLAELRDNPDHYDAKVAGWWLWGICQWIGGGWCANAYTENTDDVWEHLPHLGNPGMGIHCKTVHNKLPQLRNTGMGIHRKTVHDQRPQLSGGRSSGAGIHSDSLHVASSWRNQCQASSDGILRTMLTLSNRLRRVRVCCGDWSRVCGPAVTFKHGLTGVFLDPPYDQAMRHDGLYNADTPGLSHDVRQWCIENGDNPLMRLALCGYEGEHNTLEDLGWIKWEWQAHGGYANLGDGRGLDNRSLERVWFSPHCLRGEQLRLWDI